MNRADNSNKKNWREWDGNQEEGVDKEEIRSVHTVDWEQWGPWTKRGAGKWGGLAADSQMLLSLSDKAVRWQEWGKRLSASHKGETCSEMDRSSLSLSNQYDWDLTSTQMQSCISACGWTPVLNPVKQEVHHPASYWTNWGKRPSYVKVLPREVWQNIGEHLNPLDLYCPRLAVKLLVEMTHLITYRCAGCRRSYPWTSVAVCRGCQQVQCKRCAEPKEHVGSTAVSVRKSWSVHLCGERMKQSMTCPTCTRHCVSCTRACCDSCGWRGGRGYVRNSIACLPCVVASCHFT